MTSTGLARVLMAVVAVPLAFLFGVWGWMLVRLGLDTG